MAERASADQATLACDALTIYPLIGLAVLRLQTYNQHIFSSAKCMLHIRKISARMHEIGF